MSFTQYTDDGATGPAIHPFLRPKTLRELHEEHHLEPINMAHNTVGKLFQSLYNAGVQPGMFGTAYRGGEAFESTADSDRNKSMFFFEPEDYMIDNDLLSHETGHTLAPNNSGQSTVPTFFNNLEHNDSPEEIAANKWAEDYAKSVSDYDIVNGNSEIEDANKKYVEEIENSRPSSLHTLRQLFDTFVPEAQPYFDKFVDVTKPVLKPALQTGFHALQEFGSTPVFRDLGKLLGLFGVQPNPDRDQKPVDNDPYSGFTFD